MIATIAKAFSVPEIRRKLLFAAAMLGQLAVVKAIIEANPAQQHTPGPHGIPLITHAKMGGDAAAEVVAYLQSLTE